MSKKHGRNCSAHSELNSQPMELKMKKTLTLLTLSAILSTSAFAKIVTENGQYFIESKQGKAALLSVNDLVKKKAALKVKTFGEGKANLISFSNDGGPETLHSVDEKGFIYAIKPFSSYTVTNVDADGKFQFKEVPKRKYVVDAKGFFFY